MLVRELLFLSQLRTTSIYTEISSERKKIRFVNISEVINSFFLYYGHNVSHLIFASCYVRDTLIVRVTLISRFLKLHREIRENLRVAKISWNKVMKKNSKVSF